MSLLVYIDPQSRSDRQLKTAVGVDPSGVGRQSGALR
jgi:hypothetical protein